MPDYQFNTNLGPAQQQGTSLADLINTARGVQAYQQAEQINPLAQRKAKAETETAETGAEKAKFGFETDKAQKSRDLLGALSTSKAFRSGNRQEMLKELSDTQKELERAGFKPHEALIAVSPILDKTMRDPQGVVPFLENAVRQSVSAESRLGLQKPTMTQNAAGQTVAANPVTGQFDVMGTPQTNPMGVRTQTFTDPVTGNIVQAPVTPQGTLGAPSNLMGGAQAPGVAPQAQPSGPQAVPTGSTAETERARATQAINSYVGSVNALTDASKPGHIPTQEFIAKKLLTYLKDPSVNTGPIADVLAGKSNQATLTSKEQEVLKLIQQRIQNLNPRTDADAQSKKDAYGSFRLKKDALTDLIRQDLGNIQNQKLLANGMMNAAGDPRNPNLPSVNKFQAEYTQFSKDPALMQYMGIVGTGQKAAIDEHDKEALRKLMRENGLSSLAELEQKRKQLIELSGVK